MVRLGVRASALVGSKRRGWVKAKRGGIVSLMFIPQM